MKTTDAHELLRAYAQDHSESAFQELVNRYVDLVYSSAIRRVDGDTQLAEDITQEVFTHLAGKAGSLPPNLMLGGWLHRHTGFAASTAMRSEQRRRSRERQAVEMNSLHESSEADWKQLAPVLDEAMDELDAADRDALVLRYFERRELRAVGAALGVSDDTAQKRVSRAVERLRKYFAKHGVTVGASRLAFVIPSNAVQMAPTGLAITISAMALATPTTGGAVVLGAVKTMTTTKLALSIVTVVAVGILATLLFLEYRSQSKLVDENGSLRQQIRELAGLKGENEQLFNLLAEVRSASAKLPDDRLRELLKLRGEVGLLRQLNADVAGNATRRNQSEHPADSLHPRLFAMRTVTDSEAEDSEKMTLPRTGVDAVTGEATQSEETLFVQNKNWLDQTAISSAFVGTNWQTGRTQITISLTPESASQLARFTRDNLGKRIAVLLDGKLCSTPVIRNELTSGKIPVDVPFSEDEARKLVQRINEAATNRQ